MVGIRVRVQRRKGFKQQYDSFVVTIPKAIIDALPDFKNAHQVEVDVANGKILITLIKEK